MNKSDVIEFLTWLENVSKKFSFPDKQRLAKAYIDRNKNKPKRPQPIV